MTIKTFRKNPVEIQAVQFTGTNFPTVNQFVGKIFPNEGEYTWGFIPCHDTMGLENGIAAEVWDKLHDTWVGVKVGQWIIRGVKGEFYPCDDEVFRDSYTEVQEIPVLVEEGRLKMHKEK